MADGEQRGSSLGGSSSGGTGRGGPSSGRDSDVPPRRSARVDARRRGATKAPSQAASTATSSKTSSAAVRAREADLQLKKDAAALEEKIDQSRRDIELLEHEVKFLIDQLEEVRVREVNGPDEEAARKLEMAAIKKAISQKTNDAATKRINLKYLGKSVDREKELIEDQRDLEQMLLEYEEGENLSQDLTGEDVPDFYDEEDFLSASGGRSLSPETKEFIDVLTREVPVRRTFQPPTQPTIRTRELIPQQSSVLFEAQPSAQPQSKSSEDNQNAVANLATALTEAIKAAGNNNSQSSDKFLARQTLGKDLPAFSGKPEEWMTFYTSFTNTTNVCEYTNVDNLVRLQKCLKGDALRHVQCLMTTPENVPVIIKELKLRFGDAKHIINALTVKVNETPPVRDDKPDALIDLGIAVKNLVSTIKALEMKSHLNNPTLLEALENKLSFQYRMQWATFSDKSSSEPTLIEFNEWISKMVELACKMCPPKLSKTEEKRPDWRKTPQRVHAAYDSSVSKDRKKCVMCSKEYHHPTKCISFISQSSDEKWKLVRKHKLCFSCLNIGHSTTDCRSKRKCDVSGCDKLHHRELHTPRREETSHPETQEETLGHAVSSGHVNLNILPVRLTGPKGSLEVLAMLDSGSTLTVINSKIADQLGLKGPVKSLTHSGLHDAITVPDSRTVSLTISGASGKRFDLNNVRTVPSLSLPRQSVQRSTLRKWKHLQKLNIEEYGSDRPTILIGQDNVELCNTLELVGGPPNAPMAGRTELGWLLMGRVTRGDVQGFSYHVREDREDSLHQLVKEHFTNESFGVKPDVITPRSREDARAMELMEKDLKRVGDGWEAGLLWKTDDPVLPHSAKTATNRLHSMERKMDRDPEFAKTYEEKMSYYIKNGFAVRLTPEEVAEVSPKTYYLSHFMARNPKKQNKYRLVFDAKAKEEGVSLNDMLLIGPDQLVPLPAALCKIRERKIGMTADIKDMFHRVKVKHEDAAAQRFLWRGMRRYGEPDVYEMRVLIFGAACSPALAQQVKNRNAKEFHDEFPESSDVSVERIYMDDYTDSVDTVSEATQRFTEMRTVMSSGGFDLGKWGSNSKEFLDGIPEDLKTDCAKSLSLGEESVERVLGLFWNQQTDKFTFSLTYLKAKEGVLNGSVRPTKREVLALVMSIFDPLGFLSVYTVRAKMLLQDLWKSQIGWDDEVPTTVNDKWNSWISQLKKIPEFQLHRCYSPDFSTADCVTLHMFVDASEKAYGAVAYFVTEKDGNKSAALVMSKSRVAPTKPLSIPRMELQAAVMGSRLGKSICDYHSVPVTRKVFWSDSRTVLCWINSDGRKFQPFVSHRIGEIQELTDVAEWRWVPTKQNVADELTRDIDECEWGPESRWIHGPDFLLEEEHDWPKQAMTHISEDGEALELKKECVLVVSVEPSTFVDVSTFSSWSRLRNTVARVLDAAQRMKKRLDQRKGVTNDSNKSPLVQLQREAELLLQRKSQEESFGATLEALKKGNPVPKDSQLCGINVVMDGDGLLRIEGRLEKCLNAGHGAKSPVILDRKNPYTKLLLSHYHERSGHHGQERVVNEVRQLYFIPRIRTAVRATWAHCQRCKNARAAPSPPQMGQLPSHRVESFVFPFKNTGLDYFGPVEVTVGRRHEKRWVAIFTCLSTRAVHVEIAASLSTDSCIQAIRRFVGRRGSPENLFSDNGTNFHGSNNELKRALAELNQNQMEETCATKGIAWHFNPPAAPHMGGSWERLVRSIKVALKATLKERYPKEETFHTLLVEAEHSVNSHPLTHVSVDPEDPEALTPNHFLIGRSSNVAPGGIFGRDDLCGRKQWRQAQQLSELFWKRWMREYLPSLQRRTKWLQPSKSIAVGDIVLEVDPQQPRNSWPKGVVEKVFPGEDGVVRVVEIRTATGRYRRPVVKLAVLDVHRKEDSAPKVKFGVP